ncbi:MAG: acetyl-CoA carboxylase biotin carboxyl carrier protein [Candidatus Omnitrophica bacterium]|nr:acetyl-CoA carboxylase biotin carboxyl carrier protein [Candidatus Omnitrophota bacterium]
MNIKKIQELIELMSANELTEVEIEQEGLKIRLIKKPSGVIEQAVLPAVPAGPQPAQAAPQSVPQQTQEPQASASNLKEVKAPMVGTFYRSPSPEEPAYVEVGDVIKPGAVLCIVEAMKLMNEVKAEFGGRIAEICVDNAEAVEFGQPLFRVEPA